MKKKELEELTTEELKSKIKTLKAVLIISVFGLFYI